MAIRINTKKLAFITLGTLLALLAAKMLIDWRYREAVAQATTLYDGCRKAWAHRGYVSPEYEENTVGSISQAFAMGAAGVELDILYDAGSNRFMVSHDRPYQTTNGETLTLDALLSQVADQGYFWLDAKDFGSLWPSEADRATERLAEVIHKHQLADRALVESRNPLYLSWLADLGINTSYMVSPNEGYAAPIFWLNIYVMKMSYTWGPFSALSMNDWRYSDKVEAAFGDDVAIHLSTVNEEPAFRTLADNPNVKVILTDENFYHIGNCPGGPEAQEAPSKPELP